MRTSKIKRTTLVGCAFGTIVTIVAPAVAQDQRDDDRTRAREPAIPTPPPGSPAAIFGARGQVAISSDNGLSISNTSQSGRGGSTTTLTLRPAVDYFVADNFSVGGFLGLDYTSQPTGHSTEFSIGPRVGYNIPFSRLFSVWPKAGLSFRSVSQTTNASAAGGEESSNSSNLAVNLFVPVMLHPAEHFFLGFGPALDADLTGNVKTTTVAGRLTIGGWL
jgi:hypothetical protein